MLDRIHVVGRQEDRHEDGMGCIRFDTVSMCFWRWFGIQTGRGISTGCRSIPRVWYNLPVHSVKLLKFYNVACHRLLASC